MDATPLRPDIEMPEPKDSFEENWARLKAFHALIDPLFEHYREQAQRELMKKTLKFYKEIKHG